MKSKYITKYKDVILKYHIRRKSIYRIWAQWKRMLALAESKNAKVCDEWKEFAGFLAWTLSNNYSKQNKFKIRKSDADIIGPESCIWVKKNMKKKETVTTLGLAFRDRFENRYIYVEGQKSNKKYTVLMCRQVDGKRTRFYFGKYKSLTVARHVRDYVEREFEVLAKKPTRERVKIIKNVFGIKRKQREYKISNNTYIHKRDNKINILVPRGDQKRTRFSLTIDPENFYGKKVSKRSVVTIRDFIVSKLSNNKKYSKSALLKDLKSMNII